MKIYITPLLLTLPFVAGESLRAPSRKLDIISDKQDAIKALEDGIENIQKTIDAVKTLPGATSWSTALFRGAKKVQKAALAEALLAVDPKNYDYSNPNDYKDRFKAPYEDMINQLLWETDPYTLAHSGTVSLNCSDTSHTVSSDINYSITKVSVHGPHFIEDWKVKNFTFDIGATMGYQNSGKPRLNYDGRVTLTIGIPLFSANFNGSISLTECKSDSDDGPPPIPLVTDISGTPEVTLTGSTIQVVLDVSGKVNEMEGNDKVFIYDTAEVVSVGFTAGNLNLQFTTEKWVNKYGDANLKTVIQGLADSSPGTTVEELLESTIEQYAQEDISDVFTKAFTNGLPVSVKNTGFWD